MEDVSALHAAQCCGDRVNTAREAIHPYGADHERRTVAALLRSIWEGRRSALRGGGEGRLFLGVSSTTVLLDGVPLRKPPTNRSFAPKVHFWLAADRVFQGVDSERWVAWPENDLLALRQFLRVGLEKSGPDHSTIARRVRIDATTLVGKAALRSIVRRDGEEGYPEAKNSTRNW